MKTLNELTDLNGYTQAELFPMYANFILSNQSMEEISRVNQMIINRWSGAALILIKDKAWRILKQVPKGQQLSKYL